MNNLPVFITGNQQKVDYLAEMLGITLGHEKIELDEIQSVDLDTIVTHKVKQAYERIRRPVLVEDVGLNFTALSGLPGPFIKFFVEAPDGLEHLCRMLDGFDDRSARAVCTFGYYDGIHLELFHGGLDGVIATSPRGENGYGWDRIFEPHGYGGKTRAELTRQEDAETYAIIKPFAPLREFLKNSV